MANLAIPPSLPGVQTSALATSGADTSQSAPLYAADLGQASGTVMLSSVLGLATPRNVQNADLAFAQIAAENQDVQTETDRQSYSARQSEQQTELDRMANALASGNVADFFNALVSFLLQSFVGISGTNAGTDGMVSVSALNGKETAIDGAVGETADLSEQFIARDLARDIVTDTLPADAGNPDAVIDRATGLALSVVAVDQALGELARADAPLNGLADSPVAAANGRLQLAV